MNLRDVDKNTKIIVLHESVAQSFIKDALTFGCIGLLAWFNHRVIGGGWVIDVFCVIAAVMSAWKFTPENCTRTTAADLVATVERARAANG
jgi:hypothetical protein